jgi:hypothetical protein
VIYVVGGGFLLVGIVVAILGLKMFLATASARDDCVWRLEVWGRVRGWVDFCHPFLIEVSGEPQRP